LRYSGILSRKKNGGHQNEAAIGNQGVMNLIEVSFQFDSVFQFFDFMNLRKKQPVLFFRNQDDIAAVLLPPKPA